MPDRYSSFSNRKPRKQMRMVSDRREREEAEYDLAKQLVRKRDKRCQAELSVPFLRCSGPLDAHHIAMRSRAPKMWTDPDNLILLCRAHHDWVHSEPSKAHDLGLLAASWDTHRDD